MRDRVKNRQVFKQNILLTKLFSKMIHWINFYLQNICIHQSWLRDKTSSAPPKRGISECYSVCFTAFDMEPTKFIYNSFESWDSYVRSKYNTISEQYHGDENYIFYFQIHLFITLNCPFVNSHELLKIFQVYAYIFFNQLHFFIKPWITLCQIYSHNMCYVVDYAHGSLVYYYLLTYISITTLINRE